MQYSGVSRPGFYLIVSFFSPIENPCAKNQPNPAITHAFILFIIHYCSMKHRLFNLPGGINYLKTFHISITIFFKRFGLHHIFLMTYEIIYKGIPAGIILTV